MSRRPALVVRSDAECVDEIDYDVAIVGGGIAGLAVAYRIAILLRGSRIVVLELGPMGPSLHMDTGSKPSAFERWCEYADDPYAVSISSTDKSWLSVERHVLGGRGLYWGGVLVPMDPAEFGGDAESLAWLRKANLDTGGYQRIAEQLRSLDFYVDGGTPFRLTDESKAFEVGFVRAAQAARIEAGRIRVFSPLDFFDSMVEIDQFIQVLSMARVLRIANRGNNSEIELVSGPKRFRIRAKQIVLAAGTRATAEILGRSLSASDPVEFYLEDHLVAGAGVLLPRACLEHVISEEEFDRIYFCPLAGSHGFNLFLSVNRRGDGVVLDLWGMGEKDRGSPARLLVNPEALGNALRVPEARFSKKDNVKIELMLESSVRILSAVAKYFGVAIDLSSVTSVDTKTAMRSLHFGNSAIGHVICYRSPVGSVDHDGCLSSPALMKGPFGWDTGLKNTYLAGAAAFLRMGSANPTFSTLLLSNQLAEHIVGSLS